MRVSHSSGAIQALYRVFVLPTLQTARSPIILQKPPRPPPTTSNRSFSTGPPCLAKTRAPEQRTQKWNEEIRSPKIYLVNTQTGELSDLRSRRDVLANLNTETHRLVQVDEQPDPNDPENGRLYPVCKILGKKEMYQQEKNRKAAQKEAKKASATANTVKTLELNWAIDGNDLGHRLERMKEFLTEGMKVEIVLAAKKAGRKANAAECEDVLQRIRGAVDAVPGARLAKALEGTVGRFCTVLYQGRSPQAQAQAQAQSVGGQKEQQRVEGAAAG